MNIPVATLRRALETLDPVVPRKTRLPACQYILVGGGQAIANNIEVAAALDLPEAEGDPVGITPDTALAFLERVPGEALAALQVEEGRVTIEAAGHRATFKALAAKDFPMPPQVEAEHDAVTDGEALIQGLQAVFPFAATKGDRPVLTAVCLTLGERPRLVTGDGFRLRLESLPGRLPGEGNLLIPRAAIRPLEHLWKRAGKSRLVGNLTGARSIADVAMAKRLIRLSWKGRHLKLNFGEVTVVMALVDGTFPNYELLIPKEFVSHVTTLAKDMLRAVEGAALVAHAGKDDIRLQWAGSREAGGHLHIGARSEEAGEVTYTVPAICEAPGRIAFGCRYLLDYLAGKEGMVRISVMSESAPALFTYHGQANHVLMPRSVDWNGPSPFPQPAAAPESSPEPTQDSGVDPVKSGPQAASAPISRDENITQDRPQPEPPAAAPTKPRPATRKAGGKAKPA